MNGCTEHRPTVLYGIVDRTDNEPPTEEDNMTAYRLAQALVKALREQFPDDAEYIHLWSAQRHSEWSGQDTKAPAIVWEEGPSEWAYGITGWNGERIGDEYFVPASDGVRAAYAAIREHGFYCECLNSFALALYTA